MPRGFSYLPLNQWELIMAINFQLTVLQVDHFRGVRNGYYVLSPQGQSAWF